MATIEPLFVGATRPTLLWGVASEAFLINTMLTTVVFLAIGNPFYLVIGVPIHAVMVVICLKDPRAFRLLFLWVQTKGRSLSRIYWRASSASPLTPQIGAAKRAKDRP